jgi:hypothetical protein
MCLGQDTPAGARANHPQPSLGPGSALGDLMPEMPLLPRGVFVLPGSSLGTGEIMGPGL